MNPAGPLAAYGEVVRDADKLDAERARSEAYTAMIIKEQEAAQEMAKKIEGVVCTLTAKVSHEGRLYGSIVINDIVESLKAQGVSVEKRMVLLADPIKEVGSYKVPIRLYKDVEPEIVVEVVGAEKND